MASADHTFEVGDRVRLSIRGSVLVSGGSPAERWRGTIVSCLDGGSYPLRVRPDDHGVDGEFMVSPEEVAHDG